MPKAVARKVEFTIAKFNLDVDIQLIPLVLTPEQCREYKLPRTPIKETERRKNKFEQTFGVGATELDALEALHPGEMARLLEEEINNYRDPDLGAHGLARAGRIPADDRPDRARMHDRHFEEIDRLKASFNEIVERLEQWGEHASELWSRIASEMEDEAPDLSGVKVARPQVSGKTDRFVLFDSKRDPLTQLDHYHMWRDGDE
jgi:hypothetical protein